ncbi:MAG: diguanylate cyclase, partial [Deltaproteobacteria bacterium]|nr:diguanylate cyclase [Deltaproteobacteria bacterium]
ANKKGGGHFTGEDESLLFMLAFQSATAVENARLYTKTTELATTDGLTSLLNRRAFMERLTEEAARSSRYEHYFSFLLIDIDHFKLVNDTYGHAAGDAVLKLLAQILKRQTRSVDIVGRYGGEEFAIILPETNSSGAQLVGERIRNVVSKLPFILPNGSEIGLTISIGIACFPSCAGNIEQLIERADAALYSAKNAGRNLVYLYRETLIVQLENNPEQLAVLLNNDAGNIEAVISAMDVKASFFREHTEKVRQYAMLLSQGLGLQDKERDELRLASLLHDIGFVATPTIILRKAGNLTDEEEAIINQHPAKGAEIIKKVAALQHLAPIIQSHHERYDGAGYPDGLKGDDIPYLARVIAVADAYASMTSGLPWRKALSKEEALKEIQAGAGLQFDPKIVEVFCRIDLIS